MANKPGTLYIVATPIGNLGDISKRAEEVLGSVDVLLAEDTRHTRKLLTGLAGRPVLLACHEHNEERLLPDIIARLCAGDNIGLVADAGTPLISDPGYRLVKRAHEQGITVSPVPGPAALIAALSAAGIPSGKFIFEGFLPARAVARRNCLQALAHERRTLIFYEAPRRIAPFLADATVVFGPDREATLARELTKLFESVRRGRLSELLEWVQEDVRRQRGEFVVVIAGSEDEETDTAALRPLLKALLASLSLKQSVQIASELHKGQRNRIYKLAQELRAGENGGQETDNEI